MYTVPLTPPLPSPLLPSPLDPIQGPPFPVPNDPWAGGNFVILEEEVEGGEAVFTLMDASTLNRTSTLTIDTFDVTTGQPVDWWEGSSFPVVRADKVTNEERWRKGWNPFPR